MRMNKLFGKAICVLIGGAMLTGTASAEYSVLPTNAYSDGALYLEEAARAATASVTINAANFPDSNFRSYVSEEIDTNSDGVLSGREINNCTKIDVRFCEISDLKGIERFKALNILYCGDNQLTSLNVSGCTKLTTLNCYNNQLTSLNVSKNTALKELWCSDNRIKKLNVSKNTALTKLWCSSNRLTSLNVSKNTALTDFACSYNIYALSDTSLDEIKNNRSPKPQNG